MLIAFFCLLQTVVTSSGTSCALSEALFICEMSVRWFLMWLIESSFMCLDLRVEDKCLSGPAKPNPKLDHRLWFARWISALCLLCHSGPIPGTAYTDHNLLDGNPKMFLFILICSPKHQTVLVSRYFFNPVL